MMRAERHYYVYLLTNYLNTVIYTGVTSRLHQRVTQHRDKTKPGFTSRYEVWKLVYFEDYGDVREAIGREKQMKSGSRQKKVALIETGNPAWRDLFLDLDPET